MISKAATTVSYSDLKKTETLPTEPLRSSGANWKPVKHSDLINSLVKTAKHFDHYVDDEIRIIDWYGGYRLCAAIPLTPNKDYGCSAACTPWIGIDSSNDGERILTFYSGITVDNIPIVADKFKGSKFTQEFDLDQECINAFTQWGSGIKDAVASYKSMIRLNLPSQDHDSMMIRVGRRKILPWSKIGIADNESQQSEYRKKIWGFHSAVSKTIGLTSGPNQMENQHSLFKMVCNRTAVSN